MSDFDSRSRAAFAEALDLIATASNVTSILSNLCRTVRRMVDSDIAAIALADSDMAWHIAVADGNISNMCLQYSARVGEGFVGAAMERCVPVATDDYSKDLASAQFVGTAAAEILPGEHVVAAIATPMMIRGSPLGALIVGYRRSVRVTPEVQESLETMSRLVAIALDGHRLLTNAREQALHAEMLNTLIQKIRTEIDPEEVARVAATTLGRGIDADQCIVFLADTSDWKPSGEFSTGIGEIKSDELLGQATRLLNANVDHEELEFSDGLHSVIVKPIQFGGEETGLLMVTRGPSRSPWTIPEKRFVSRASEEISKAIGHARLLESESAALARLRELDQIKNEFVSVVSHELRTPLTSIKGFTSTLIENYHEYGVEERMRFLGIIQRQAERLERLIAEFLDVSRIQQGTLTLNLGRVDLGEVAREAIRENESAANGREIICEGDQGLVEADREKILQVISNLVSNAIKYGAGTITVTISDGDGETTVVVRDEGKGVSSDQVDNIFDKFFQVDQRATRHSTGVGLGLAIVKGLVEAHGGQVWYEDAHPHGACFCFTLPWVVPENIRRRTIRSRRTSLL